MAIIKKAKNITIQVKNKHTIVAGGVLSKTAEKINIEATEGDLTLISGKKVTTSGSNGVKLGRYSPTGRKATEVDRTSITKKKAATSSSDDTKLGGDNSAGSDNETSSPEVIEYVVHFGRLPNYQGEYGFDWMREEYLPSDDGGGKGICVEGLEDLKKVYTPFRMNINDYEGNPYGNYHVPWLTMFPNHKEVIGKDVELILTTPVKYISDDVDYDTEKLTVEPDNPNLRVEPDTFSLSETINPVKIKVYCDKGLEDDAVIDVKSSDGKVVGKLNVLKNADYEDYTINIPVVSAYLSDTNSSFGESLINSEIAKVGGLQAVEDYLNKQSLNQALIQVKFQYKDEKPYKWGFREQSLKTANEGRNPRNAAEDYEYLRFKGMIKDEEKMKFDSGQLLNFFHHQFKLMGEKIIQEKNIILYLTTLNSDTAGGASHAVPSDNKHCIIYKSNLDHVPSYAHEIAHTLGLMHTFPEEKYENKQDIIDKYIEKKIYAENYLIRNASFSDEYPEMKYMKARLKKVNSVIEAYNTIFLRDKYKFTKNKTENIMDYDLSNQKSFLKYQWEIMQNETKDYYH